ncbi:MAG: RNA methyltransferase [Desulfobacterales bacterium]|nr:MAG: RNA methyltransferase [Desulfobacterales bacterium]
MPRLYVALTHFPVVNKRGDTIASAVTNLDLHDISRAAKTYGAKSFYVVTPLADQKSLIKKIISHWTEGVGAAYNPARRSALDLIRIKDSIADAAEEIESIEKVYPKTVVTCARRHPSSIRFEEFRDVLQLGRPHLLVFGTAWGLAESFISEADYILEPILGRTDYNHLSVRSAAGIVLDRLLGTR